MLFGKIKRIVEDYNTHDDNGYDIKVRMLDKDEILIEFVVHLIYDDSSKLRDEQPLNYKVSIH